MQYLAADLEHPCYTGDHLAAVLTLGVGQLVVFVVGLPLLMLFFFAATRGGRFESARCAVRYGCSFPRTRKTCTLGDCAYLRKIGIVAISVFGRSIGTQRQALLAICILLVCISLEIAGKPIGL